MLPKKEWMELFGCYETIYNFFTSTGISASLGALRAEKEKNITDHILVMLDKKDADRPIISFCLEDLSYCWIFSYDHLYVIEKVDDNLYKVLKQIQYIKINKIDDKISTSETETIITYKTNSENIDEYKLDNSIIPLQIVKEITQHIKLIHNKIHER